LLRSFAPLSTIYNNVLRSVESSDASIPIFDELKQNMFDFDQKTLIVPLVICYVGGIITYCDLQSVLIRSNKTKGKGVLLDPYSTPSHSSLHSQTLIG
jgi:hypothetical protein